jgi:malate synthase
MHEILHALKDYAVGLNCGRWDYIFSTIKKFHARPEHLMPDRTQITMNVPFLKAYYELLIQTCHKRGCHAMGGMSAFIPVKGDAAANDKAFAAVRADKEREAGAGHDGTWVAHPGLIPVAMEVFDRLMPEKNQRTKLRLDVKVSAADLIAVPSGTITEAGVRNSLSVAMQYTAHWLNGNGCVPINNLMEDAATAEISRSQLWQWLHHGASTAEGKPILEETLASWADDELDALRAQLGEEAFAAVPYERAKALVLKLTFDKHYVEFLTLPAYDALA